VRTACLLLAAALLVLAAPVAHANPRVGRPPLSDQGAAAKVVRSAWEPRPRNAGATHRVPTAAQLRAFRRQSDNPYAHWVTGNFRGTTDEVMQWAAAFGLFQVRRPYHCRGTLVCGLFRHDAALNADYWASIVRSYYDGRQTWLNTVSGNGARYASGDLWGSIGAWFSGRWHDPGAEGYVAKVKGYMQRRVWRTADFVGGG
jgi:hypothetical protein